MTNKEIEEIKKTYPELKNIDKECEIYNHFDYKHSPNNTILIKKDNKIIGWKSSGE